MVVDDSKFFRQKIHDFLTQHGHTIVQAENGAKALEQFQDSQDLDLILCDVNMPVMDGITFCENFKPENKSEIPIIMLTTETSQDLKSKAKELGVKGWMPKKSSFNFDKLLMVIKSIL